MTGLAYGLMAGALLLAPADDKPTGRAALKALGDMLVGQLEGQGVGADDAPGGIQAGDKFTGQIRNDWVLNGTALESVSRTGSVPGKILIFWDPARKIVRSVGFVGDGSLWFADISGGGRHWVWKHTGDPTADGSVRTGTETHTISPSGLSHVWEGTGWTRNGRKLPDSFDMWRRGSLPNLPREAREALDAAAGDWTFEGRVKDKDGTRDVKGTVAAVPVPGGHGVRGTMTWTDKDGTGQGTSLMTWDTARKQIVLREAWSGGWSHTYRFDLKGPAHWDGQAESSDDRGNTLTPRVAWRFAEPRRYDVTFSGGKYASGEPGPQAELHFRKVLPAGTPDVPRELADYGKAFVGTWEGQVIPWDSLAQGGDRGKRVPGRANCRWILDGAAVEWAFRIGDGQALGWVYWDPAARQLKYLGLSEGDGGPAEAAITRQKDGWSNRLTLIAPDGKKTEISFTTTLQGPDQFTNDYGTHNEVWKRVTK